MRIQQSYHIETIKFPFANPINKTNLESTEENIKIIQPINPCYNPDGTRDSTKRTIDILA